MDSLISVTDIKSFITFLHLSGLALGLGGAWILDLFILKHLKDNVMSDDKFYVINFVSKIVVTGLAMLWLSGLLFLSYYYYVTPENLLNEKIWAKISIVIVLTINGFYIHTKLLPRIRSCIGSEIYSLLSNKDRRVMVSIGTISFFSWLFPIALGVSKSLNFSTTMLDIIGFYVTCVALSLIVLNLGLNLLSTNLPKPFHQEQSNNALNYKS